MSGERFLVICCYVLVLCCVVKMVGDDVCIEVDVFVQFEMVGDVICVLEDFWLS